MQQQHVIDKVLNKYEDRQSWPVHDPSKFMIAKEKNKIIKILEDGQEVGFEIDGINYEYDFEDGFFEPNGCYYSNDFEPKGWWVLDADGQEHFYDYQGNLHGEYQESDEENDQQIEENVKQVQ